jgi:acyl-CoA thioester hydrolase
MTTREQFSFFDHQRVRYAEVDMQGIAFNAHYLTWFDCALNEYLRYLNYDYHAQVREQQLDFHLVKSVVEYLGPIRFDQMIDIGVRAARVGRSSLSWELAIFAEGSEVCLTRGEIVWVCARIGSHQSHPLPSALIAALPAPSA